MSEYDNTNTGVFFINTYKEKDTQPDYKGKINVEGIEKEIAIWHKFSKNNKEMWQIKVSDPYVKPDAQQTAHQAQQPLNSGGLDDEIPF